MRTDAGPPGDRGGDVWDGYIESYMFRSGSDRVRIIFDSATGDGPRGGIVIFGEGTPPPPASDPEVGYPPGDAGVGLHTRDVLEGFEYAVVDGRVDGSRVRLSVRPSDLYAGWCALQTPVPRDDSGDSFGCLPNTGGGMSREGGCFYNHPTTGEPVTIDCRKLYLCRDGHACACNAVRCTADDRDRIAFDFHVVGDNGDGSVILGELHNVHLTR